MNSKALVPLLLCSFSIFAAALPEPKFRAVEIDNKIEIGYGVTVADVDGDGKPDILLADKKQFVWYKNPTWEKFLLAENLTREEPSARVGIPATRSTAAPCFIWSRRKTERRNGSRWRYITNRRFTECVG